MTPLMQQYGAIKSQYPEALVLFQVGDFYELFHEDAKKAAECLRITLTKRGKSEGVPIPLCGVPKHAADHYIMKLVQSGFHVVVCDQRGEVESGKLVDRAVQSVITPGMIHDARLLDAHHATITAVVTRVDTLFALWWFELVTGQIGATVIPVDRQYVLEAELCRLRPREIVLAADAEYDETAHALAHAGYRVIRTPCSEPCTEFNIWLKIHASDDVQRFVARSLPLQHAGMIWHGYVGHNVPEGLLSSQYVYLYMPDDFLMIDAVTQRDLELVINKHDGTRAHTLWDVLDESATAMGSRILRSWLLQPLCQREAIEARLDGVDYFVTHTLVRKQIYELLRTVGDLERIAGRVVLGRATVYDYRLLRAALPVVAEIVATLEQHQYPQIAYELCAYRDICTQVAQVLQNALADDGSADGSIRMGYHEELDKMRALSRAGEQEICSYEQRERETTGVGSLKIRLNGTYGYGIEITKTHRAQIPGHYRLVQALVNRDRYTTPQLLQLEHDIQYAVKRAQELERELFQGIVARVRERGEALRTVAMHLAYLDGIMSFARAAVQRRYVRPRFTTERVLHLERGRHPVVEGATTFVPNSVELSDRERLWVITGPNMGGKSTFLRQVALIAIMAQAGSFVPAARATLPLFDRLFTRIGASDQVHAGKSTFWVEMEEVARMCREATACSLIILDEIGRGTSTHDGMAIAQAVIEYLAEQVRVLGLCATHYQEVARAVGARGSAIGLYHVAVAQQGDDVVLLHSIRPGIAEGSFGLVVAEKAGVLPEIVTRAQAILDQVHLC